MGLFARKILFAPIVAAAAAGPYLYMNEDWKAAVTEKAQSMLSSSTPASPGLLAENGGQVGPIGPIGPTGLVGPDGSSSAAQPVVTRLSEVARFDVSPSWVMQRWPRVSTVRSSDNLHGLRVPVVTGTELHDLSGSLTYYFDRDQKVQRLCFYGYTGDPGRLIELATRYLQLRPEPSSTAGMFVQRWNGEPTSALRITHSPVVNATNPRSRLIVQMEVNRPGESFRLSPEFSQLLQHDTLTRRW